MLYEWTIHPSMALTEDKFDYLPTLYCGHTFLATPYTLTF